MSDLYLMAAPVDLVNLARFSAERRHSDPDRTAHCFVAETFGGSTLMPKPFVIKVRQVDGVKRGTLLAYTSMTAQELVASAQKHQKLAHSAVMDASAIRTVRVPCEWTVGQSLSFEVRVAPTKRSSSRDSDRPKSEADIYWNAPPGLSRGEAYCEWLSRLMERQGGFVAPPDMMRMERFSSRKVRRQRNSVPVRLPDATISGTVTVADAGLCRAALSEGIGRAKGFGYGMILVRMAQGVAP